MRSRGRDGYDFSESTKRIIALRANYECAVPGCTTPTSGPGATPAEVALSGTAAHIRSAAERGPRGREGLSDEQIRAPENGLWTCATHGRLIDTNRGSAYPTALLLGWRELQEAKLRKERDHQSTSIGWLHTLTVQSSFLFETDSRLQFGKCTLLIGGSRGKTAVCDWVCAALGEQNLARWREARDRILFSAEVYLPEQRVIDATISETGLAITIGGIALAEVPRSISTIYVKEGTRRARPDIVNDDERIAAAINTDASTVRALLHDVNRNGTEWGRRLEFYEEPAYLGDDEEGEALFSDTETEVVLRRKSVSGEPAQSLATFSGSETDLTVINFACALARERSRHQPTLLVMDENGWTLDESNLGALARYLARQPFQTLMSFAGDRADLDRDVWGSWSQFELVSSDSGTAIHAVTTAESNEDKI